MISCVRRLQFAAGHRVYGHESKCANVHGHNYVVYLHARAKGLDEIGRIIDFSVLKERFGEWIDSNWDHGMILYNKDPLAMVWCDQEELLLSKSWVGGFNPTAELMAEYLLFKVAPEVLLGTGVEVFKVTLWETENCFAEAELPL